MMLLLVAAAALPLCGCLDAVSDRQWEKTVPGVYEGRQPNFRELLELNPSGNFHHEVFINGKPVLNETGNWSYDVQSGMVRVEPFTLFYDREARKTTSNGVLSSADGLGVPRYGKAATKLSPSIHHDYCLSKKNVEPSSTNRAKD